MNAVPGAGHRLRRARPGAAVVAGALRAGVGCSAGCRATSSTASCSARSSGCARRRGEAQPAAAALLRRRSRAASCSAGSPTTSTTSRRACSRRISQLLTSLLTVVGVLVMMFVHLAAARPDRAGDHPAVAVVTAAVIAKRSQKLFVAQWKHTGELNGQIEETYTGHALVKVFGRQREVEERFRREERGAVRGRASARSSSPA